MADRKRARTLGRHDAHIVWERREPITPAGRPVAGAAQIAATAIDIADRNGLYDVSVKRVANRLGISAFALVSYVPSKDDLLDLVLDAALGEIDLSAAEAGGDWRARLTALACATQAVIERHPWLRTLAGTRTPSGPNGLRVSECTVAALGGLGLPPMRMLHLANTVLAYVYGFTQLEMGHQQRGPDGDSDAQHRALTARHVVSAVAGGNYPNLAALFADHDGFPLSPRPAFELGLSVVLDGVAAQLEPAAL